MRTELDLDVGFAVTGLTELERKVRTGAIRAALFEVTALPMEEMRERVPQDTGTLAKAIGRRVRSYAGAIHVAVVGVRANYKVVATDKDGRKRRRWAGRYAHLKEFGFDHVGGAHVPATPFIRPTFHRWEALFESRFAAALAARLV